MHRFRLCRFPGDYYVLKPGRANRLDPYWAGGVSIFDAFSAQAVVNGELSMRDKYGDELDVPCYRGGPAWGLQNCDSKMDSILGSALPARKS